MCELYELDYLKKQLKQTGISHIRKHRSSGVRPQDKSNKKIEEPRILIDNK
jgi:hypothetical protein